MSSVVRQRRVVAHRRAPRRAAAHGRRRSPRGSARWARLAVQPTARSRRCARRAAPPGCRGTCTTAAALDVALGWWDPDATYVTSPASPSARVRGVSSTTVVARMSGTFPRSQRSFFEPERGVTTFDAPRARDTLAQLPVCRLPRRPERDAHRRRHARPAYREPAERRGGEWCRAPRGLRRPVRAHATPASTTRTPPAGRGVRCRWHGPRDLKHWSWLGAALADGAAVGDRAQHLGAVGDLASVTGYVMYYAARDRATGLWCLSYAVAPAPQRGVRRLQHRVVPVPGRQGRVDRPARVRRSRRHAVSAVEGAIARRARCRACSSARNSCADGTDDRARDDAHVARHATAGGKATSSRTRR